MDEKQNVIPFGKHKGLTLDEIAARDPGYLQWLQGQPWVREKFQYLIVNINNFDRVPEETPAHNRMQMRFLDEDYCRAVASLVVDPCEFTRSDVMELWRKDVQQELRGQSKHQWGRTPWRENHIRDLWERRNILRSGSRLVSWNIEPRAFEVNGADVVFIANRRVAASKGYYGDSRRLTIELKPLMGDDYPAVLRQIKKYIRDNGYGGGGVLLVGEYTGSGASLEEVRQFFELSNIVVVLASEVEARLAELPDEWQP